MADGPILFRGFENIHEYVLGTDTGAFAEQLRNTTEQRLLLFHGAAVEHGNLDVDNVSASGDAVGITVAEVRLVMLGDGDELVVFRNIDCEFEGNPTSAALHIITVTRGLAVLERAFGDEAQLKKIGADTVNLVLGKKSR